MIQFDLSARAGLRINIFIQTRTSNGIQNIRVVKAPDRLLIASQFKMGDSVVDRSIAPDYPGYDANDPEAIFNR
jgi:hypothetical protein